MGMDLLEIRELRYFVTVAEELHFGRAAARLSIAQPALSKSIQRVESRLRVQLFDRTSRSVALTSAGAALLEHGRHALNAMTIAVQNAQRAAGDEPLRFVIKPGGDANLLSGILAAYAQHPCARQVDILFSGATDRTDHLRDGRADAALLYAPFDDLTGFAAETLHVEDRVAVLPEGHRLAARDSIDLAELDDEVFPRWPGVPDAGNGPEIADGAALVALVRIGRVVAVVPRSLITPAPPGIVCVPVPDAGPSRIVIARRERDHRNHVTALVTATASLRQQ
ncbi:LysR family transcriptional regulator [Streptomyces noursei ZPM]|uniref:LysR family transcriptional regulator n=2 Tax=Streptomyces noursei TaxID=1971 RepID=A0A401QS81_STRNR|nr:LysR family transcriptional regulator [Streptomyces noursei ZPM]EOT05792.1 LysR family transcriptional regulator [Streptomyces noursei CCRC 11814]GCB88266.1 LysR family transcriptional regulator [Streptomyces noursei]